MGWGEEDEQTWHDTAQVCLEGYMVNDQAESEPECNKKFCSKCGVATILACLHCSAKIKGYPHIPNVASCSVEEPEKFCDSCGHLYPWSESSLKATLDLAAELDTLSDQDRADLRKSLPDLLRDVPNTPVAAMRFKKILRKVGEKGGGILWELLKDVASKTATKIILGE